MVDVNHQWSTVENNIFLLTNYPDLNFVSLNQVAGKLKINATYDPTMNIVVINPKNYQNDSSYIDDEYIIRIELPDNPQTHLPIVFETAGRIRAVGEKKGITNNLDLHLYKNGCVCLCPRPLLIERIINGKSKSLPSLLDELITPYFYQQSYFERFGHWPIKNYSHGFQAIFEYYFRESNKTGETNRQLLELCSASMKELAMLESRPYLKVLVEQKKEIKPTSKCFCGSNRKYKKCHRRLFTKDAKLGFSLYLSDLRKKDIS